MMATLLNLPSEIRHQIYTYVYTSISVDNTLYIDTRVVHPFQISPAAHQPPLSQVCKQLREETLPIFYSQNAFVIVLLNDTSVRKAQRWIERQRHYFPLMNRAVLKVYPSFDGRALGYEGFRWHAHGPYWLPLSFTRVTTQTMHQEPGKVLSEEGRDHDLAVDVSSSTVANISDDRLDVEETKGGQIEYLRGVTQLAGILAPRWSTSADGWLMTTVEMLLEVFAERLESMDMRLVVDLSEP